MTFNRTERKIRKVDPIKAMVAQSVQHHLVTGPDRPALLPKPDDVEEVEAQILSPTETLMRVKTYEHGVRYFKVKVSEMM
jgi:hypothetical protein